MALTLLLQKEGGGAQGIFSCFANQRVGDKSTTHCISNCGGIQGIGRISYCYTGWLVEGEGVLHVSYCSTEPWLAGQLLSGPLPGSARCWLLQPEPHSSAISLLKGKSRATIKETATFHLQGAEVTNEITFITQPPVNQTKYLQLRTQNP